MAAFRFFECPEKTFQFSAGLSSTEKLYIPKDVENIAATPVLTQPCPKLRHLCPLGLSPACLFYLSQPAGAWAWFLAGEANSPLQTTIGCLDRHWLTTIEVRRCQADRIQPSVL